MGGGSGRDGRARTVRGHTRALRPRGRVVGRAIARPGGARNDRKPRSPELLPAAVRGLLYSRSVRPASAVEPVSALRAALDRDGAGRLFLPAACPLPPVPP